VEYRTTAPAGFPGYRTDKNLPRKGVTFGLLFRQGLTSALALQLEANYLAKGGQLTGGGFVDDAPQEINYLNLPLLLNLRVARIQQFSILAEAGYSYNIALSSQLYNPRNFDGTCEDNLWQFAPVAGAEVNWQRGRHTWLLNFRYSIDQSPFRRRTVAFSGYPTKQYDLRNAGFTLTTGVLFGR
jgi:hypothetical protein